MPMTKRLTADQEAELAKVARQEMNRAQGPRKKRLIMHTKTLEALAKKQRRDQDQ